MHPSVYKFLQLLKLNEKNELVTLSLYVKEALVIRNTLLNVER